MEIAEEALPKVAEAQGVQTEEPLLAHVPRAHAVGRFAAQEAPAGQTFGADTLRMTELEPSAVKSVPSTASAMPAGVKLVGEPSEENPTPFPITVVTVRAGEIMRRALLPVSDT